MVFDTEWEQEEIRKECLAMQVPQNVETREQVTVVIVLDELTKLATGKITEEQFKTNLRRRLGIRKKD